MGNWAKQARIAWGQKNYTQAGDFYKLEGDYKAAIRAYLKGKDYVEAARIFENLGNIKKAEKILKKYGAPKDLAEFHIRNDDPEVAVTIFLEHGLDFEAAELFEKMNQPAQAAVLYERLNFFEKAGVLYGKTKNFDKAILMFTKVIHGLELLGAGNISGQILKYQNWIANLHVAAKRFNQAGEIFEKIQQKEMAAKCYGKGGHPVKAAKLMLEMSKPEEAKKILKGVQSLESRTILGKIALEQGDHRTAVRYLKETNQFGPLAEAFEHLGQYREAAFFLEKSGDLPKSAAMYARARDFQKAALLFEQNGMYEEAGQSYEKQKKYGHAAKLYHLAKNRFKAGMCLYKLNRLEDALKQLQLVQPDHDEYQQAQMIKAEIFFTQGVFSVARKLLEELTSQITLDDNSLNIFYLLARSLEEEGDLVVARNYYDRIMARKFDYADVAKRLKKIQPTRQQPRTIPKVNVSPFDLTVDDMIAERFKVVKVIGKGGMGSIFKVRDLSLDRDIALKMLLHDRGNFEDLKGELLIARDLTHAYIIKVFDVGQWLGVGYFTMEYVEGNPLKTYIRENIDPLHLKIELLIKICQGLKAAHDQDIVHRDIKPQNILIDRDGNPKILDFGIARKVAQGHRSETISGSPKYMAPEQIRNITTDLRTDIYALGIIMFYMFTGREPFLAKTPQEVMHMHLEKPLPDPFQRNEKLPFWLCDIIKKCCKKNPDMRYSDMAELIEEFQMNLMEFEK